MKALPFEQGFFDNKSGGVMGRYIMALDQGTTSSRCILFDKKEILYQNHQKNMNRFIRKKAGLSTIRWRYGHHSLVLPLKLWQWLMFRQMILKQSELQIREKRQLYGIKKTGKPVYNAIVWQCRRTADSVEKIMHDDNMADIIKKDRAYS